LQVPPRLPNPDVRRGRAPGHRRAPGGTALEEWMQTVLVVLGGLVVGYLIGRLFATPGPVRYARVQAPPLDDALPPPGESARKAAESVRAFGALVDRLAARDVAVAAVVCEPGTRWQLAVERGADADRYQKSSRTGKTREKRWVTRVSWNARGEKLSVAKTLRLPGFAPNRWQQEPGSPIGLDGDAIGAAEALIIERFAKGAGADR
jgi:hypothetical protein